MQYRGFVVDSVHSPADTPLLTWLPYIEWDGEWIRNDSTSLLSTTFSLPNNSLIHPTILTLLSHSFIQLNAVNTFAVDRSSRPGLRPGRVALHVSFVVDGLFREWMPWVESSDWVLTSYPSQTTLYCKRVDTQRSIDALIALGFAMRPPPGSFRQTSSSSYSAFVIDSVHSPQAAPLLTWLPYIQWDGQWIQNSTTSLFSTTFSLPNISLIHPTILTLLSHSFAQPQPVNTFAVLPFQSGDSLLSSFSSFLFPRTQLHVRFVVNGHFREWMPWIEWSGISAASYPALTGFSCQRKDTERTVDKLIEMGFGEVEAQEGEREERETNFTPSAVSG